METRKIAKAKNKKAEARAQRSFYRASSLAQPAID